MPISRQAINLEHLPEPCTITRTDKVTRLAQVASIGAAAYFFFHCLMVITGTEKRLMEWLYDDAFYYLIVAKHFSERHISSFDGVTVTSGYHPLWMWLCAAVYGIRGHLDLTYVRLCMGMTTCISMGLLVYGLRANLLKKNNGWLWALALGATSYSALNNGITVMEWPLVLLVWALLHGLIMRSVMSSEKAPDLHWVAYTVTFLLGIAGSLSRTDFGLIPACYLVGGLLVARHFKEWNPMRTAAWALAGAVAGLGLVFLYNHSMTGSWIQQSAQVKHIAASFAAPFNPVPAIWQFARVLLYLPALDLGEGQRASMLRLGLEILLPSGLFVAGFAIVRRRWILEQFTRVWFRSPSDTLSLTSAALGILGYLLFYSFNSQATYGWYTATVTGFVLVLSARIFSLLGTRACASIVLPLMVINMAAAEYRGGNARSQSQENSAGRLMRQYHAGARMGGGDVGKPSFYNEGKMFNLDGLMNNEVVPYLVEGRVHCYILKKHIEYLSDTGSITVPLTDAVRAKRKEATLPWSRYFILVEGRDSNGEPATYLKTDFDAISNSGECAHDLP
jgi:hypothetical protein